MKPIMTKNSNGYSICFQLFGDIKSYIFKNREDALKEYKRLKTVLAKHRKGRPERVW